MNRKECVVMLLAGGEGRRLKSLTKKMAKPAVHFGGKYRIIDFPLSNCTNSGMETVGVLTQYEPLVLNNYIGSGSPWDLDRQNGGVSVLPPFSEQNGASWYLGTAHAIYMNFAFIEQYQPDHVLILSGDHIYKMDYSLMLQFHKEKDADVTIAAIEVPWKDASRFGIMETDAQHRILAFREKPAEPASNLASMGIYIFKWPMLKKYLTEDDRNPESTHDFGKDIIPLMLRENCRMFAYPFKGYWRDVGTVESLWEANMDLLSDHPELNLNDPSWRIYSRNPYQPAHYISPSAIVKSSIINEGCIVHGDVRRSVLFYDVQVGEGSVIRDSVIMPHVRIGRNVRITKAIIGEGAVIEDDVQIGTGEDGEITLIDEHTIMHPQSMLHY
jgi:glucose-1-phosphate adenylyltransferase